MRCRFAAARFLRGDPFSERQGSGETVRVRSPAAVATVPNPLPAPLIGAGTMQGVER